MQRAINHPWAMQKGESQSLIFKVSFQHYSGEYGLGAVNFKNFFLSARSCLSWRQMWGLFPFLQQCLLHCIWCPPTMTQSHVVYPYLLALISSNLYCLFFYAHPPAERKCFCHTDFGVLPLRSYFLLYMNYLVFYMIYSPC